MSVHPKGDQSWVIIGRTDAEAKTPVLWPPHAKSWLIGKDSDAGRDWGQEETGMTEDEMAGWHHWLDGLEFGWPPGVGDGQGSLACCDSSWWWTGKPGVLQFMGLQRVGHDWVTELTILLDSAWQILSLLFRWHSTWILVDLHRTLKTNHIFKPDSLFVVCVM